MELSVELNLFLRSLSEAAAEGGSEAMAERILSNTKVLNGFLLFHIHGKI